MNKVYRQSTGFEHLMVVLACMIQLVVLKGVAVKNVKSDCMSLAAPAVSVPSNLVFDDFLSLLQLFYQYKCESLEIKK